MTSLNHMPPEHNWGPMPRWFVAAVLAIGAWFLGAHLVHVFTESVNWDEFALLARADRTLRFGEVVGDGRPGLVSIVLIAFVRECVDSVQTVVHARLLWAGITLLYLGAVYCLVRRWFVYAGRADEGKVQGLLAVVLLAFLPAFVTWSVQVRTDQAALAASVWGGVLLLSTSWRQAAGAGILFGIALLCTQKALYTIGLSALLYATASVPRFWPRASGTNREVRLIAGRLTLVAAAMVSVLVLYLVLVPNAVRLASSTEFSASYSTMDWYRETQGYRVYTVHASRLVVHWALFVLLVFWTLRTVLRRTQAEYLPITTSWLVLALGTAVAVVHGSRFPYFLMTAGLFPAIGLSLAAAGPLGLSGRMRWPVTAALLVLCASQSAQESIEMLGDTQHEQRETMQLIRDSGLRSRRGYSVEGALFCAADPDPMPTMFSQQIWRRFKDSPQEEDRFVEEFRNRPIAYLVDSYRLNQFPPIIRAFIDEHYVWYDHGLFVAGFPILPTRREFHADVVVAGRYRWKPSNPENAAAIEVGGSVLAPFESIHLGVGTYRVQSLAAASEGSLVLAELPEPTGETPEGFYIVRQIRQLGGRR